MKKIVYFITKSPDGNYGGRWITGTFTDGKRGMRGEIPGIENAVVCGYGATLEEAKRWAVQNGINHGILAAEVAKPQPKPLPQCDPKPQQYGKLAVYWHSGIDQKTEEFSEKKAANDRYAELLPDKEAGRLAILEARFLVVDVAFEDGRVYTYFAAAKHKAGTTLYVATADGIKAVKVVKEAYWQTKDQLEAKCRFDRYKVAYSRKSACAA